MISFLLLLSQKEIQNLKNQIETYGEKLNDIYLTINAIQVSLQESKGNKMTEKTANTEK